jgi:phage replication O-like protein O
MANPFTKVPNERLEEIMKLKNTSEIKIALAALRKIDGYQKESDQISFSQFKSLTGLTQKGINLGIQGCLDQGILEREKVGYTYSYKFKEKLVSVGNQYPVETSILGIPKLVSPGNSKLVSSGNTQKKYNKEKKEIEVNVSIPDSLNTPEFREMWIKWISYRQSLKKVKDFNSLFSEQLTFLSQFGVQGAVTSLQASLMNGWQGIFAPKGNFQSSKSATKEIRPSLEDLEAKK